MSNLESVATAQTVPRSIASTPRPRDRKAQILAAASRHFYRSGYHNVGTEVIADSVGVTPGALYRHFRSKQDMLAAAVAESLDRALRDLEGRDSDELGDIVQSLAITGADRRELGVLWSRESRHLPDDQRRQLRGQLFGFLSHLTRALRDARSELTDGDAEFLAWCALAVATSPSYHQTDVARERLIELLHQLGLAVCTAELPGPRGVSERLDPRPASLLSPLSRREALIAVAARLFNQRGYQDATMEDIASEVGLTSTSVYRHFATKADLLTAVVVRGSESLHAGLSSALAAAHSPREALDNVVAAYVDFAMVHHDLLGVLVAEVIKLPDPYKRELRRAQHDYVAEWIQLLGQARPDLDLREVRVRVYAVLTVVNDVARTAHLRRSARVSDDLVCVAAGLLYTSSAFTHQSK